MTRISKVFASLILAAIGLTTVPTFAQTTPPVVVELFTSQGCSSCPPANANLIALSDRPDVLVLSFAVTYWDRLGWKDTFGQEAFTERQVIYEPALGEFGPFTPQMVVNGRKSLVGNRIGEVELAVSNAAPMSGPALDLVPGKLIIGAGTAPANGADIWQVTYDPHTVEVPVARGENTGRTLAHTHVVHDLENLGSWTGAAIDLPVAQPTDGLKTAILVQGRNGGAILSVVTN